MFPLKVFILLMLVYITQCADKCPQSHPYAYYNGKYCCKTAREKVYRPQGRLCDGGRIGISSLCCENNQHTRCPHGKCKNYGCSQIMCRMFCPLGFDKDADGCTICKCKQAPPPVNGNWGVWTAGVCSKSCGDGILLRERLCNNPSPSNGGLDCLLSDSGSNRDVKETKSDSCNLGACPDFGGICNRDFKKLGCFSRNWSHLTDLLITDLDPDHPNFTVAMNWDDLELGLHSLACRCREKATKGHYKYFALGFHGECVSGKDNAAIEKLMAEDTNSDHGCINGEFSKCDKDHPKECIGIADYDFIYEITSS